MKYLFIGGPADGLRIECEGRPYIQACATRQPSFMLPGSPMAPEAIAFNVGTYRLEKIVFPNRQYELYVLSSMHPDDVMTNLIDGYRIPNENTCKFWEVRR